MERSSFTLFLLLALLAMPTNAQGQSSSTQIAPPQPQFETDQEGDDLELSEPKDQSDDAMDDDLDDDLGDDLDDDLGDDLGDDLDDDLDSEFEEEEEPIVPQRLSDDRIRENWPKHSLATINLSFAESGRVPEDRSELLQGFGRVGSVSDTVKVFGWEAPSIRYQPLYFEDVVLERYGQTLPDYRQSVRSAIHFGTAFTGLGFQLLETPPRSCDSSLGYCRPGDCVPQTTQRHFFGALSLR